MSTLLSKIVADFTTQLATAISTGGTTASLQSATDDDGVALPTGQYLLTIDGNNSQKEYWLCDLSGTSLTNIQNVSRQGALSAGCLRDHRVGASVSITDFAHILYINNLLTGVTDLDEDTPLKYAADPGITSSDLTSLATVQFVVDSTTAGAPDATNLVKGITKLSVAAVSPTDPIAVGDNDTRVPTQGENDALVGTSGTPGSSNKYVTNDDTTSTPTADKVVRALGTGKIDNSWISTTTFGLPALKSTFLAGENITAGNLVSATYYQADGGVTFNTSTTNSGNLGIASSNVTANLTIGNNTNRVLIVAVGVQNTAGNSTLTTPTFNGQALTLLSGSESSASSHKLFYVLFNPTVGAGSLNINISSTGNNCFWSVALSSYYNVAQTLDGSLTSTSGGTGTITNTFTPTVEGAVVVSAVIGTSSAGTNLSGTANMQANQVYASGSSEGKALIGDSKVIPKKSLSISGTNSSHTAIVASVGLAPITAPTYGYVKKTTAAALTNAGEINSIDSVIGFAETSVSTGASVVVDTNGVYSGLSSLIPLQPYYASDTPGAVSLTAGSQSKKIGNSISTSSVYIKIDN